MICNGDPIDAQKKRNTSLKLNRSPLSPSLHTCRCIWPPLSIVCTRGRVGAEGVRFGMRDSPSVPQSRRDTQNVTSQNQSLHGRRLEVVVDGLPLFGSQWTHRQCSPLRRLRTSTRRKDRTWVGLRRRVRLFELGIEVVQDEVGRNSIVHIGDATASSLFNVQSPVGADSDTPPMHEVERDHTYSRLVL